MPVNVRQTILDQAENRQFHFVSKSSKIVSYVDGHLHPAALLETLYIPSQGNGQTAFVEQRRMQQIRHRTNLLAQLINELLRLVQPFHDFWSAVPRESSEIRKAHA